MGPSCAVGLAGGGERGLVGLFLLPLLPQKLLEECEQNWEKVEECHRLAKQYIDAIKVRGGEAGLLEGLALQAGVPRLGSGGSSSRPTPLSFEGLRTSAGHVQSPGGARLFSCQEAQSAVCLGQHHPGGEGLSLGGAGGGRVPGVGTEAPEGKPDEKKGVPDGEEDPAGRSWPELGGVLLLGWQRQLPLRRGCCRELVRLRCCAPSRCPHLGTLPTASEGLLKVFLCLGGTGHQG